MGMLVYGFEATSYEFDDRTLSHLKIAIVTKLRRHEAFLLSWEIPAESGSGRVSLWISREIPLGFVFQESRPPELNARWMEALLLISQRTGGMQVIDESEVDAVLRL